MPAHKGPRYAKKNTPKSKHVLQAPATVPRLTKKQRQVVDEGDEDDDTYDSSTQPMAFSSKGSKRHSVSNPIVHRGDSPGPSQDMTQILNLLHSQQKKKASAQAKKLERDIETRLQDAQRQSEAIVARFEQDSEESLARYLDTLDAGLESAVDHIKVLRQTFDEFQTANLALVDSLEKHASHAGKRRRDQAKEDEQMHNGHAEDIAQAFGRFEKEILGTRKMLRKMNKAHHDTTKFSQHLLACVKP